MRQRFARLIAFLAMIALLIPAATVLGSSLPDSYALPGDSVFPEGVAVQPGPDYFYVSSTADGTIFRGQLEHPEAEVFLPGGQDGRIAAVGLAVDAERDILYVSGGNTGTVWAYNVNSRQLVGQGANEFESTFINDVTVTPDGSAYFTDSFQPVIYRMTGAGTSDVAFEVWLDLTETPIEYQDGFNLNGVVATLDGAYLIVVHSSTGALYRISTEDGETVQIDLDGDAVPAGDGLVLRGHSLIVVQNSLGQVTTVRMSAGYSSGQVWSSVADPSFRTPTTAAILGSQLLVVNAQFGTDSPVLPFSVSSIPVWQLTRVGIR